MATDSAEKTAQTFAVGAKSELSVSNVSGSIKVHAGDSSEISVSYNKRGSSKALENTQVEIEKSGNRVTVQTRSGSVGGLINFGRSSSVNFDISVPRDCAVKIHAVSADVNLEGPRAETGVQTVSGDIRIEDVAGDTTISTISGTVAARSLSGTLVARTTSGDARILTSRLRRFSLNSVSGDFEIETPLDADEHCNAKTVSGDLQLVLPSDTGATVQLKSISGSVSCELPAEIIKAGRRHWQGRINGGGGHVEMNSVSGDLKIRRSGNASQSDQKITWDAQPGPSWPSIPPISPIPPIPRIPPIPSIFSDTRVRAASNEADPTSPASDDAASEVDDMAPVLAALERGEISVEEAMARLA